TTRTSAARSGDSQRRDTCRPRFSPAVDTHEQAANTPPRRSCSISWNECEQLPPRQLPNRLMEVREMTASAAALARQPAPHRLGEVRTDWTLAEVQALFALPFADLIFHAQRVHREQFDPNTVQISTLLSIKTGACPEDCGYCSQSARF